MNIQQFHRAFTESDDPTIVALRELRKGDPRATQANWGWIIWPAATERTANHRESAELGNWLVWNQRESAELGNWLPWGVRDVEAASPA